jgi:hypothetical protein
MAYKKGRSEKKTDWLGNKYIQHYDSKGKRSGKSIFKEGFFGNKYTQHYDSKGNKRGKSEKKESFWGKTYTKKYNTKGDKSGWSEKKEGFFGNKYIQHYDAKGNKTDRSVKKEGFWGNQYIERFGDKPDVSSQAKTEHSYSTSYSPSNDISRTTGTSSTVHDSGIDHPSSSSWSGLGWFIFAIIIFLVIWFVGKGNKTTSTPYSTPALISQPDPVPMSEAEKRNAVYNKIVANQQSHSVKHILSTETFKLIGKVKEVSEPQGSGAFWDFNFIEDDTNEAYSFGCSGYKEVYFRISNKDVPWDAGLAAMKDNNNRVVLYIRDKDKDYVDRCSRGSKCDGSLCPIGIEIN